MDMPPQPWRTPRGAPLSLSIRYFVAVTLHNAANCCVTKLGTENLADGV